MMSKQILLVVMLLEPVFSFQIQEGCEVKAEWKLDYKWPDIHIGAWASPENEDKILNIEVLFEEHTYPLTFDSITVYKDRVEFEEIRNGKGEIIGNMSSVSIQNGWMKLLLTINNQYSLKYLADYPSSLLQENVSYLPKQLQIKGSNVTCNCPSGLRIWEVTRDPVFIPLDDLEDHPLSFYSTKSFLPTVFVDMRKVTVGWDGETLTTIPSISLPLPQFMKHKLTQTCTKNVHVLCIIKVGENLTMAEELRVAGIPKSLTVAGRAGDSFYVMLLENNSLPTENNSLTTISSSSFPSDHNKMVGVETECKSQNYIPWILAAVSIASLFIGLVWVVIKNRKVILRKVSQTRKAWSKKGQGMELKQQTPKRIQGKDDGEDPNPFQTAENGEHDPML